jgi:hypothetical protein
LAIYTPAPHPPTKRNRTPLVRSSPTAGGGGVIYHQVNALRQLRQSRRPFARNCATPTKPAKSELPPPSSPPPISLSRPALLAPLLLLSPLLLAVLPPAPLFIFPLSGLLVSTSICVVVVVLCVVCCTCRARQRQRSPARHPLGAGCGRAVGTAAARRGTWAALRLRSLAGPESTSPPRTTHKEQEQVALT